MVQTYQFLKLSSRDVFRNIFVENIGCQSDHGFTQLSTRKTVQGRIIRDGGSEIFQFTRFGKFQN